MHRRESLEMPACALPADAGGRTLPGAIGEPCFELARRHRPPVDRHPRVRAVGGEDLYPRALDGVADPRQVARVEPLGRNQVVEAQAGEITHRPAALQYGHHDVIVAPGDETGSLPVEAAALRILLDPLDPYQGGLPANRHAGAYRRTQGVLVLHRSGRPERSGEHLSLTEVAHGEKGEEVDYPGVRFRLEQGLRLPADGAESPVALEKPPDLGEVARGEDVVVVDEDDGFTLGCTNTREPGRG